MASEFRVNTYVDGDQEFPEIASTTDGGFVITWGSWGQDGSDYGIYAQRYDYLGVKLGGEFQVNSYTTGSQQRPAITGITNGGFVIAWYSDNQDGSSTGIYAQRYDYLGVKLGVEFQVNSYTTDSQVVPKIAGITGGGFVITWFSGNQDGSSWGIYAQRYDSLGNTQGLEFQVNSYTTAEQESPKIAGTTNGGFVITWHSWEQDGSDRGVYAQRYDNLGDTQGGEFRVNSYTDQLQAGPAITETTDGGFIITWNGIGQDGSDFGIYAQRYDNLGGKLGEEFKVNSYTDNHQGWPRITTTTNGGFVITWASWQQDSSGYGVYAQRYNNVGVKLGGEFQVNSYTSDDQIFPVIASTTDGGFVITWHSLGQDSSGDGIYAKRYNADGQAVCPVEAISNGFSIASEGNAVLWAWSTGQNKEETNNKGIQASTFDRSSDIEVIEENIIIDDISLKGTRPYAEAINNNTFLVAWDRASNNLATYHNVYARQIDKQGNLLGSIFTINDANNATDCCVTLANNGNSSVTATWLRKAADNWHIYMKEIIVAGSTINNNEVGIATSATTNATHVSMTYAGENNLVVVWEEGGNIKSGHYDGTQVTTYVVNEESDIAKRASVASLGDNVMIGWDSALDSTQEPNQIYGRIADKNGEPIDQKFNINSNFNKNQCCVHLEGDEEGNIIATWLSYDQGNNYNIIAQRFNNEGQKVGDEFSLGTRHHPLKSYKAEKVNIANTAHGALGSSITILENLGYCGENSLVDKIYLGDGGTLIATIESFFLRSYLNTALNEIAEERSELRYNNRKHTTEIKNIGNEINEVNKVTNNLQIRIEENMGLGTEMSVAVEAIQIFLDGINVNNSNIEMPDTVIWQTQNSMSMISNFDEMLTGKTNYVIMQPKTCKDVKLNVQEIKEIEFTTTVNAEVTGYKMLGDGTRKDYDLDTIKNFMEQRTNGIEIIEHSLSNKVIAKVDAKLILKDYQITVSSQFIDYCGEQVDQQNYVMLYQKNKGFLPIDKEADDGLLNIGSIGQWCNIHTLKIGDFNGDGKSDLFCHLMDGTTRMMLNNGTGFVKPSTSLDDDGAINIASFNKWCAQSDGDRYLYLGDFNKDGKTDLFCHHESESQMMLSDGVEFVAVNSAGMSFCYDGSRLLIGSFNTKFANQGKSDLLCQSRTFGVTIATSNHNVTTEFSGFDEYNKGTPVGFGKSLEWCTEENSKLFVGDFNGDGKSDLLCNKNGYNYVMFYKQESTIQNDEIYLFTAAGSPNGRDPNGYISIGKSGNWCAEEDYMSIGDFDGDGKDDLYCNHNGKNMIMITKTTDDDVIKNEISFESISLQNEEGEISIKNQIVWCESEDLLIGDFNADGYADLLCNSDNNINI